MNEAAQKDTTNKSKRAAHKESKKSRNPQTVQVHFSIRDASIASGKVEILGLLYPSQVMFGFDLEF